MSTSTAGTARMDETRPDELRRIRHHFTGAVQSRSFRYACVKASGKARVTGWVENQTDGSVIAEARGRSLQQKTFLKRLSAFMPGFDFSWFDQHEKTFVIDGERSFSVHG